MRYISLFSGIEAATVAAEGLGWVPVAFSEIDPFPSAVLAYHYPDVPNLGDITKVDWRPYRGKCDLIVGGSPCQSFSIAGKREGLNGESGLMWEYVRAVREVCPEWVVWENVPGALSSSGGEDFRCLLSALDELGYGLAWRILDAQFFGVPQRRRRVFLVGHFGERPPTEILFERESLRGDLDTSSKKRQALAARAGAGTEVASRNVIPFAQNVRDEVRIVGDGSIAGALAANPGMKQTTYVCETAHTSANGLGVGASDVMSTLDTNNSCAVAVACTADNNAHAAIDQDVCGTLKVGGAAPMIAYDGV